MIDFQEQAADIHRRNHKWWHTPDGERLERNKGEMLMLVVSELSEAMEGLRKNLMDDHLPHRRMAEVEIADAYIRMMDFAAGHGLGLNTSMINTRNEPCSDNQAEALFEIADAVTDVWVAPLPTNVSFVISLIIDFAEYFGYDLFGAVEEKLAYNDTRADHKWEARQAANGKKF